MADAPRGGFGRLWLPLLAGFAVSRLVVVVVAFLAAPQTLSDPDPGHWNRGDTVLWPLLRWDAGYYLEIAERGYSLRLHGGGGATTLAFFPAYPLVVGGVARVTGLEVPAAAVLAAHVCFLVALILVAVLVAGRFGDDVARRSVLLAAFLPWSAFASFPYTEAMFLAVAAGSLLALDRGRLGWAAALAAVATATRLAGLAVVAAIAAELWRTRPHRWRRWLAPVAGLAGIAAFAVYLGFAFARPLAFVRAIAEPAWKRSPLDAPAALILAPARSLYHVVSGRATVGDLDVWLLALAVAALAAERRRLPPSWLAFAAVGLALPVGSGSLGSIGRYLVPLFPVVVALALRLERRPALSVAVVLALAAGLAAIAARYALWLWES